MADARHTITAADGRAALRETGGPLLGWWDSDKVNVRSAGEVVDPAAFGTCSTRRESFAQHALHRAIAALGHPWMGYVGDWHSHPAPCEASAQDLKSIRSASRTYPQPLLPIVHRCDSVLDIQAARRGRSHRVLEVTA
ncbi:Mov34/MPN/PAD-1 family protein [Micromonospora sp. NPDC049240]|uniref:Mov34/MPN/PAD-1 family protein n=1 Tax=Micromonospora sp. NPDC049240 TaxID=3155151 RepID=UPI0033E7ADCE